jgi:hypothetical protein
MNMALTLAFPLLRSMLILLLTSPGCHFDSFYIGFCARDVAKRRLIEICSNFFFSVLITFHLDALWEMSFRFICLFRIGCQL